MIVFLKNVQQSFKKTSIYILYSDIDTFYTYYVYLYK